ncbi:MAG: cadherin-like domain-containing protein [Caldilineaceae bacterium]
MRQGMCRAEFLTGKIRGNAISYRDASNGNLKVARYDGAIWQIEAVDTVGDVGYDISLAEISRPTAISYYDASNGDLKYAILGNNGTFTYTLDPNFCGTDSFTYHAHDGLFDSNVATVTLNVSCVNDPPVAVNDAYTSPKIVPSPSPADHRYWPMTVTRSLTRLPP